MPWIVDLSKTPPEPGQMKTRRTEKSLTRAACIQRGSGEEGGVTFVRRDTCRKTVG